MSFAYHVPEDYSQIKFRRKTLDYGRHLVEIEFWGRPEHVVAGIDAHNEVLLKIAKKGEVYFVDQDKKIPKDGAHFNDICHLTYEGSGVFVRNILRMIQESSSEPEKEKKETVNFRYEY